MSGIGQRQTWIQKFLMGGWGGKKNVKPRTSKFEKKSIQILEISIGWLI